MESADLNLAASSKLSDYPTHGREDEDLMEGELVMREKVADYNDSLSPFSFQASY
jgi:hypothetical protein